MNPGDKKNMDELMEMDSRRDQMGDFVRQFRDRERGNVIREDTSFEKIFERAGFEPTEWGDLPEKLRKRVEGDRNAQYIFGVSMRPWEEDSGYQIFGNKSKRVWYLVKKMRKVVAWSRLWMEGEEPVVLPINHDSSLGEVIGTVGYHEFGESRQYHKEVAEQARGSVRHTLGK